jgi:hypothetical protein
VVAVLKAAVLKVAIEIGQSMEDGHDIVPVLFYFPRVVHKFYLCKLDNAQHYSNRASILVGSYFSKRLQLDRSGCQQPLIKALTCEAPQRSVFDLKSCFYKLLRGS